MIPCVDEATIQLEFSLKQIDAPMPEAPWVQRCKHQVQYRTKVSDSTTPSYFGKTKQINLQETNDLQSRLKQIEEIPDKKDSSILSDTDDLSIVEGKCSKVDCKARSRKPSVYSQLEDPSSSEDQSDEISP